MELQGNTLAEVAGGLLATMSEWFGPAEVAATRKEVARLAGVSLELVDTFADSVGDSGDDAVLGLVSAAAAALARGEAPTAEMRTTGVLGWLMAQFDITQRFIEECLSETDDGLLAVWRVTPALDLTDEPFVSVWTMDPGVALSTADRPGAADGPGSHSVECRLVELSRVLAFGVTGCGSVAQGDVVVLADPLPCALSPA